MKQAIVLSLIDDPWQGQVVPLTVIHDENAYNKRKSRSIKKAPSSFFFDKPVPDIIHTAPVDSEIGKTKS